MQIKFKGRCHFCKVPLDPYVDVSSVFEYFQVAAWSAITRVDITANDTWYKFISAQRAVKCCRDCYWPKKTLFKDILKRETTGHKFKSPKRKSWNDAEILTWYSGIRSCPALAPDEGVYLDQGFVISTTSLMSVA